MNKDCCRVLVHIAFDLQTNTLVLFVCVCTYAISAWISHLFAHTHTHKRLPDKEIFNTRKIVNIV